MLAALAITLVLLFSVVIGWHLIFSVIGGVIAITAAAWGFVVASVVILCVAILLLFVLTGTWLMVLGGIAFVWTVLAVIFFPILFPILAPLFILFLFVSYIRNQQKRKKEKDSFNNPNANL